MRNAPTEGETTPAESGAASEVASEPKVPKARKGDAGATRPRAGKVGSGDAAPKSKPNNRVMRGAVGERVIEGFPLTRAEIELMVREVETMQKERSLRQRQASASLTVFVTLLLERMVNQFAAMAVWQNAALNALLMLSIVASLVTGILWMRAKPSKSIRDVIEDHIAIAMKAPEK